MSVLKFKPIISSNSQRSNHSFTVDDAEAKSTPQWKFDDLKVTEANSNSEKAVSLRTDQLAVTYSSSSLLFFSFSRGYGYKRRFIRSWITIFAYERNG